MGVPQGRSRIRRRPGILRRADGPEPEPAEFLTDEQADAYGKFAEEPTRPEPERFFFLDDVTGI
ncbi:hypothetical protein GCM10010219_49700 [Streptomyces netropsis]|nr:hypothetical protein GCM10010219_49700 [Streptomyces netropsis]